MEREGGEGGEKRWRNGERGGRDGEGWGGMESVSVSVRVRMRERERVRESWVGGNGRLERGEFCDKCW